MRILIRYWTNKNVNKQAGLSLVEMLIIISIMAIIVSLSYPSLRGFLTEKDIVTTRITINQTLNHAKHLARSRGVFTNYQINDANEIILTTSDNQITKKLKLSNRIKVNPINLVFRPSGTTSSSISSNIPNTADFTITIGAAETHDTTLVESVSVSSTGAIATL